MHIGADVGTHNSLIGGLVQLACVTIGEARLREAIPHLGAEEARIATTALRTAMAELPGLAHALRGEETCTRLMMREQFQLRPDRRGGWCCGRTDHVRQTVSGDPAAELDYRCFRAKVEEKIAEMQASRSREVAGLDQSRPAMRPQALLCGVRPWPCQRTSCSASVKPIDLVALSTRS